MQLAHCHLHPAGRDAWTATLGPDSAQSAVRAVHVWLVRRAQLYRSLALLLEAAVPAPTDARASSSPAARHTPPPGTPPLQQTVPTAEALTTILTSRNLAGTAAPAPGTNPFRVASGSKSTCLTATGLTAGRTQTLCFVLGRLGTRRAACVAAVRAAALAARADTVGGRPADGAQRSRRAGAAAAAAAAVGTGRQRRDGQQPRIRTRSCTGQFAGSRPQGAAGEPVRRASPLAS